MVACLYRRYFSFVLAFLAITVAPALTACGKLGSGASDGYTVALDYPASPDNDSLYALPHQVLRIEGRGEAREVNWSPGSTESVNFDENETLTFLAYNADGELRVTGSVQVGKEKKITIPLREVK